MFDNIGSLQVQIYVSEMALAHYGAHMTAKDGLKSDKNVVFSRGGVLEDVLGLEDTF